MQRSLGVLIVEDSEDDALLLLRELRRGGYEVTTERVDTAAAMKSALARGRWDVVIADHSMPQFSALAALQVLKESGLDLPFIIVSGAIGEDVAVEAMRGGAHDYLMKDKLARLIPAVDRELREAEVRRQRRQVELDLRRAHDELEQRVKERTLELAQANEELQRAKVEAETANQAKDQFLGVVSHELRTPLAAVLLTSSLLDKRRDLPSDVHADIETICRNVELEARIIDDLLDLTRIARGKLQFDFQKTDLHRLIRQAAEVCRHGAGAKIQMALSAKRRFVRGDPARLQQVFWNLLSNARKFTPADGQITVRSADARDGKIRVEVVDTGVGIDPESLPRIFAAFEQGNSAQARQLGGLGLGLAICKAIVDAHGGTISAFSAGENRGATFTLELDAVGGATQRKPRARPRAAQGSGDSGLRILLVEDYPSLLNIMVRLLVDSGHQVQTATDVRSALELAAQEPFDLLISDLRLPDGNGYDLMRILREKHELKGIALSGYGSEDAIRKSQEAGFAEHLTKPVDAEAVEAAIRSVMGSRPAPEHRPRGRERAARRR